MSDARVKNLDTWRDFVEEVNTINDLIDKGRSTSINYYSNPLYRGQPNADWKLETTLERETMNKFTLRRYHEDYVKPAYALLSCFESKAWTFDPEADCSFGALNHSRVPNYEFIGYLRHHGFPSPLLDWTSSPYVAAFFAFDVARLSERVAIFWYQEFVGNAKSANSERTRIVTAGPIAAVHKRHFLQQSEYSICFDKLGEDARINSHEIAINDPETMFAQDKVMKFTLPSEIRNEALFELDRMNINPYSVYQSEDSLVKTIGNRLFVANALKIDKALQAIATLLRKEA